MGPVDAGGPETEVNSHYGPSKDGKDPERELTVKTDSDKVFVAGSQESTEQLSTKSKKKVEQPFAPLQVKKYDQSDRQVIEVQVDQIYNDNVVRLSVGCADPGMLSNAIRSELHRSSRRY